MSASGAAQGGEGMQQDLPPWGPGRAPIPGYLLSIRRERSERVRAEVELMARDGVMGTGIFLLPALQGAFSQRQISRLGMHTKKGCANAAQTSPPKAAPARPRYSPVSPRSMAGGRHRLWQSERHQIENQGEKTRKKKSKQIT